jgi:hypothetical protein
MPPPLHFVVVVGSRRQAGRKIQIWGDYALHDTKLESRNAKEREK